jgi:hypothetical protein
VRQLGTIAHASFGRRPWISVDGVRGPEDAGSGIYLVPASARRLAELGVELTWANIGVENTREDSLGALKKGQWQVLEYTTQRMLQTACMVALAAYAVTPQPALEEAVLEAIRLLPLAPSLVERLRRCESVRIDTPAVAQAHFDTVDALVGELRELAGNPHVPASFDSSEGWLNTILCGYDWINVAAHLNARFPATAVGGRGTAEEARDVLASNCG